MLVALTFVGIAFVEFAIGTHGVRDDLAMAVGALTVAIVQRVTRERLA